MTSSDDALRSCVAAKLASGGLRHDDPVRTRFSKGQDRPCVVCNSAIKMTHVECATQFADLQVLSFHRDCYYAWDSARGWRDDRRPPASVM
jgi:hypothetical protein